MLWKTSSVMRPLGHSDLNILYSLFISAVLNLQTSKLHIIISAMLCMWMGQYAMQSLFWALEDISVAAWTHRASNQQIKLADTI